MAEKSVYRISILCPDFSIAGVVAEFFNDLGYGSGFRRFDDSLENIDSFYADIFTHDIPDTNDLTVRHQTITSVWGDVFEMTVTCISDTDWVSKNQQDSVPIVIGAFFVYQPVYTTAVPSDKIGILVRADQAFGTGSHYTTAMCLNAIQQVQFTPQDVNILDMGTGTGILAVGAYKYYTPKYTTVSVLACDIDPMAVTVAQDLVTQNAVQISVCQADGVKNNTIQDKAPYDMVLANILAEPLKQMAPSFVGVMARGGYIILSGFTTEQCSAVQHRYENLGCKVLHTLIDNDWVAITLQK